MQTFKIPQDFSADEYFAGCAGIIRDEDIPIQTIELKVTTWQSNYFREVPLHDSQQETLIDNNYHLFTYRVRPTYDFLQTILSFGSAVEVLSPPSFREEITHEVRALAEKYK